MADVEQQENQKPLKGLILLTGSHKTRLIFSCIFSFLSEILGIVPFFLIFSIVSEIAGSGDINPSFIWLLAWMGLGAVLLKHLFSALATITAHNSAYHILYDLRVRIARKLLTLPLGYFNENSSGRIKKIFLEDVEQMEEFLAHNLPDFMGAFFYIVLTALVLFIVDWRLALASILWCRRPCFHNGLPWAKPEK